MIQIAGTTRGNIVHRVAFEPTPLAFQASALTITPSRLPGVNTLSIPICLYGSVSETSVQTTQYVKRKGIQICISSKGAFVLLHSGALHDSLQLPNVCL